MSFHTSGNNYLVYDFGSPGLTLPLSIACWGWNPSINSGDWACVSLTDRASGASYNGFVIYNRAYYTQAYFELDSSSHAAVAPVSPANTAGTKWEFLAAVSNAEGTRHTAYSNGLPGTTSTSTCIPTGLRYLEVGRYWSSAGSTQQNSAACYVAVWNDELTSGDIAALYNEGVGMDPRQLGANLIGFWPLRSNMWDFSGNGRPLERGTTNGVSWFHDPPITFEELPRRLWRPQWVKAQGGAGIAATVAQTLPKFGQSASVAIAVKAPTAQTLPSLSQSASVAIAVKAPTAQTLPSFTQSANTRIDISAIGNQTLPMLTESASAVVTSGPSASVTQSLPTFQQAASVTVAVTANIAQTLPSFSQSSAVGIAVKCNTAQSLPAVTQAASVVLATGPTANIAQSLPKLQQSASTLVSVRTTAAQSLPAVVQSAVVHVPMTGLTAAALQTLPKFGQLMSVKILISAEIDQELPSIIGGGVQPVRSHLVVKPKSRRLRVWPGDSICQTEN